MKALTWKDFLAVMSVLAWTLLFRRILLVTFGSPGDLLMVNGVLKNKFDHDGRRYRLVMKNQELTRGLEFVQGIAAGTPAYYVASRLRKLYPRITLVNYGPLDPKLQSHLMERIAEKLNYVLHGDFRPYLKLRDEDFAGVPDLPERYITMQSSASTGYTVNKNWVSGRMNEVTHAISPLIATVQVGLASDEPLDCRLKLNGSLTFRQSMAVISKAQLFIGLEGALMHAAAALQVPAVIVFGGYIHPQHTGYSSVTAFKTDTDCSPCFLLTPCPFNKKCMTVISSNRVTEAVMSAIQTNKS